MDILDKLLFYIKTKEYSIVSNSLDPGYDIPDLGPNYLQMLTTVEKTSLES